jgi:hypothetical protein
MFQLSADGSVWSRLKAKSRKMFDSIICVFLNFDLFGGGGVALQPVKCVPCVGMNATWQF